MSICLFRHVQWSNVQSPYCSIRVRDCNLWIIVSLIATKLTVSTSSHLCLFGFEASGSATPHFFVNYGTIIILIDRVFDTPYTYMYGPTYIVCIDCTKTTVQYPKYFHEFTHNNFIFPRHYFPIHTLGDPNCLEDHSSPLFFTKQE